MISIIIPAHNEEQRIDKTLEEYELYFKERVKKKEIDKFEIIVVANACKDNTVGVVKKAEKNFKEIKHLDFTQGGKGFAVLEGFKKALNGKSEIIGFVDADMATSPEAFFELYKNLGKSDGIIASRYLAGAVVEPKPTFQRIVASRVFNFLIRALLFLNYRDTQCGAKLFKRSVVEKIIPEMKITKWAFDVNLLYLCKRYGFKIKELPTTWSDKAYSKINLKKAGPQMFFSIVRLRMYYSPLRGLIKIYDSLPEKIKID